MLKIALSKVLLPELWEPITEMRWYYLPKLSIFLLAKPSSSSSLKMMGCIPEDRFVIDQLVLFSDDGLIFHGFRIFIKIVLV